MKDFVFWEGYHFMSLVFTTLVVVLFERKGQLSRTYWTSSIHEAAERFSFYDKFIEAVKDRLHVHDSKIPLKADKLSFFISFLLSPLNNNISYTPFQLLNHINFLLFLMLNDQSIIIFQLLPISFKHLLW